MQADDDEPFPNIATPQPAAKKVRIQAANGITTEGSGLPVTRAASANQNVINDIAGEKPEERLLYLSHKLKHSNRAKDWWVTNKAFKISNDAHSLKTRDSNYNQMSQFVDWFES